MIKKLRKRFVILALCVVAAVIVVIVAGIDIANYVNMKNKADAEIAFVEQRNAVVLVDPPSAKPPEWETPKGVPQELAFAARYFTVETDKDGNVISGNLDRISAVSEKDLASLVEKAKSEKGFASA